MTCEFQNQMDFFHKLGTAHTALQIFPQNVLQRQFSKFKFHWTSLGQFLWTSQTISLICSLLPCFPPQHALPDLCLLLTIPYAQPQNTHLNEKFRRSNTNTKFSRVYSL